MAQLGRALRSGRRGRRFKSCHPDQQKRTPFGVLFCWSAGERILFCRLNTPCPDQTRKTTLTVFFHTFFPSVGDKPAQKSLGVLFCWSAGERLLYCRSNTPCPNRTRKTVLTVFFHTFFPSVGDKPAQKSLGVFFIWCQGEQKACAKGWSVP